MGSLTNTGCTLWLWRNSTSFTSQSGHTAKPCIVSKTLIKTSPVMGRCFLNAVLWSLLLWAAIALVIYLTLKFLFAVRIILEA